MTGTSALRAGQAYVELYADDNRLARSLKSTQRRLRNFGRAVRDLGLQMLGAAGVMDQFCGQFICNAEQACRLVTLDGYGAGIPPRVEMSGATCHQAVVPAENSIRPRRAPIRSQFGTEPAPLLYPDFPDANHSPCIMKQRLAPGTRDFLDAMDGRRQGCNG